MLASMDYTSRKPEESGTSPPTASHDDHTTATTERRTQVFHIVRRAGNAKTVKNNGKSASFSHVTGFSTAFSTGVENLGRKPNGLAEKESKFPAGGLGTVTQSRSVDTVRERTLPLEFRLVPGAPANLKETRTACLRESARFSPIPVDGRRRTGSGYGCRPRMAVSCSSGGGPRGGNDSRSPTSGDRRGAASDGASPTAPGLRTRLQHRLPDSWTVHDGVRRRERDDDVAVRGCRHPKTRFSSRTKSREATVSRIVQAPQGCGGPGHHHRAAAGSARCPFHHP